ncbi:hypothetical protein WJ70_22545 [Burkholderia ubonensis]|nr:hypothetical protein WJ70_22545 [Burkholderia ubonensis]
MPGGDPPAAPRERRHVRDAGQQQRMQRVREQPEAAPRSDVAECDEREQARGAASPRRRARTR